MTRRTSSCFKISLALIVMGCFVFSGNLFNKNSAQAQAGDAIAVRVLSNPNHYSPLTWYKKQGFKGNPTPMKVNGYEAVRDGRTVYVNVANVSRLNLYTNIYLISYNQNANQETLDIFDKILAKWRFNSDLLTPGKCFSQTNADSCLADTDCTGGGFCDSEKARLVRDIKRLGDVVDLREKVEEYSQKYGIYPVLTAGTYLPGASVSTWPSWNTELANALGGWVPTDPINKLGKCVVDDIDNLNYDPVTCWNDKTKTFADPYPTNTELELPDNSQAITYKSLNSGQNYEACAYMESGVLVDSSWGACKGSFNNNKAPTVDCGSLMAITGQPFEGYVTARDVDDKDVVLTITSIPPYFSVSNGTNPANKKIYSASAPAQTTSGYIFSGTASDAHNNITPFSCTITTQSEAFVTYPVADQRVIQGKPVTFSVYTNRSEDDYNNLQFHFSESSFHCSTPPYRVADGRYKCDVSYTFSNPVIYEVEVYATNDAGTIRESTRQTFKVEVYNNRPVMDSLKCDNTVRVSRVATGGAPGHYNYECKFSATDPDGHNIRNYQVNGNPSNLNIGINNDGTGYLRGFNNATSSIGNYKIEIWAIDQYGAESARVILPLKIVDFCGDALKQSQNMEGKGGPLNDGREDCDGLSGTPNPGQSSVVWQYGCDKSCLTLKNGWCGDEKIQSIYSEQCDDGNDADGDGCNTKSNSCHFTCNDKTLNDGNNSGGYWWRGINGNPTVKTPCNSNRTNIPCWVTEQCDFGGNINCCAGCNWTSGPYVNTTFPENEILNTNEKILIKLPPNRGVERITFDAYPDILMNDFTNFPGISVVVITDISNPPSAQTIPNMKTAVTSTVNSFYDWGNEKGVNITFGAFGFGRCTEPITANCTPASYFHYSVPPGNLRNLNGGVSGQVQQNTLNNEIRLYQQVGDGPGNRSYLDLAIPEASRMLGLQPANYSKYMIILTDACTCYENANTRAGAVAAKAAGIKIYTVDFYGVYAALMCELSSDNGTNCNQDKFSYRSDNAGTQMKTILKNILLDILTSIPQEYTVSALVSGNTTPVNISLANDSVGAQLDISSIIGCGVDGFGCDKTVYLGPLFNGDGDVEINNIKINLLPPCQP